MARRKSSRSKSLLSRGIGLIVTTLFGSFCGGWYNPDLPVLGPLVQTLVQSRQGELPHIGRPKEDLLSAVKTLQSNREAGPPSIESSGPANVKLASSQKSADTITIATFNIQVFGESKMSKSWVVDILAAVCREFDVVAIQEVRSQNDQLVPTFVQAINADGSRYAHVVGPRLGRSVSTEQYVFVYDTTRIELDPSSVGTMGDPSDLLHREPMVARFSSLTAGQQPGFSFWLVNIHTDPDEVKEEIDVLADVFQVMGTARQDEDDVILLGDLNASEKQLGRLSALPGIEWAVHDATTNTRKNKSYDNLVFQLPQTREYTGRWGVVDLESNFGLTRDKALKVSDHLPVWAEFSAAEATGRPGVANGSSRTRR